MELDLTYVSVFVFTFRKYQSGKKQQATDLCSKNIATKPSVDY